MKKLLLFTALLIFACSSDDSEDNPLPAYTVEGKWLWSPDPEDRTYVNTMFEFVGGNVYTSYAVNCGWEDNYCTDADFNALDESDSETTKQVIDLIQAGEFENDVQSFRKSLDASTRKEMLSDYSDQ